MSKLTTIELPHGALRQVGHILKGVGFALGTVGGGVAQMERDGELTPEELASLRTQMAEILFEFVVEDLEDDALLD